MKIPVLAPGGTALRDPVQHAQTAAPLLDREPLDLLVPAVPERRGRVGQVAQRGFPADVDVQRLHAHH